MDMVSRSSSVFWTCNRKRSVCSTVDNGEQDVQSDPPQSTRTEAAEFPAHVPFSGVTVGVLVGSVALAVVLHILLTPCSLQAMATRKAAESTLYHLSPKGFWKKFRSYSPSFA